MYYDEKLKLKLSLDFTKWTDVYPKFDRYLWMKLKEEIILKLYYLHFYTFFLPYIFIHGIVIPLMEHLHIELVTLQASDS